MSEAVSALGEASFDGLARVSEGGLQGMITLRGDLSSRALKSAVKAAVSMDVPEANSARFDGGRGACWMSPDELLLLCAHEDVAATLGKIDRALAGQHYLAVDVSDARAIFHIEGAAAREVMAKLCPVDLSRGAFIPGQFRRTRMAQVPAAFWMDENEGFHVICFRSVAEYAFALLSEAAQPGSSVGAF
jgi:sarcosine oxidase, subunit gamma